MAEEQSYKVLMVDDDPDLLKLNQGYFKQQGYEVVCADDANTAIAALTSARFDCVILDVDLPGQDGFDICSTIRKTTALPIVFLSAFDEDENRIKGLSIGGDDFVCKSCSQEELALRVRLRIQRRHENPEEVLRFGALTINIGNRTVTYGDNAVEFYRIEFDILAFLARNPMRVYSYEQLYDGVWRAPINLGRHGVQARIADVRRKLYLLCPDKEYIQTIRHMGYRFTP